MYRWIWSLLMVGMIFLAVPSSSADSDENDSMADPEPIVGSSVRGNVTDSYVGEYPNLTRVLDDDSYIFTIAPKTSANLTLRKYDLGREVIKLGIYDSEGHRTSAQSLYVNVPGESDWETIDNPGSSSVSVVLLVQGDGSYGIALRTGPYAAKENRETKDWHYAIEITDGTRTGSVSGGSEDYYRITVEEDHILKIKIEKTDPGTGSIHVESYSPSLGFVGYSDVEMKATYTKRSSESAWQNDDLYPRDRLIKVYGDGNYTLTVDTSDDGTSEAAAVIFTVLLVFMLLLMLIPLMIPVMTIILVIVIVLVVLNQVNKKNRSAAKAPPPPPKDPGTRP